MQGIWKPMPGSPTVLVDGPYSAPAQNWKVRELFFSCALLLCPKAGRAAPACEAGCSRSCTRVPAIRCSAVRSSVEPRPLTW